MYLYPPTPVHCCWKEILGRMGIDKSMSRKLALNYESAQVELKVMELFRFADKLTLRPADMEKSDVERLREVGWSNEAILETVLVATRIAGWTFGASQRHVPNH